MHIIKSILDNDLYKFTMQNAIIKLFPYVKCKYTFLNRGDHIFNIGFDVLLKNNISRMKDLFLTDYEYDYLRIHHNYFDKSYLNFLKSYRYNPAEIIIQQLNKKLSIFIVGLWYRVVLWETPLMSIISELYYKTTYSNYLISNSYVINNLRNKLVQYKLMNVKFCEFGTRRRYSYKIHKLILQEIKNSCYSNFIGTSNVYMSYILNIRCFGTYSHEWIMFHGAKYGIMKANKLGLLNWLKIYPNNLNIGLTDTYTDDIFFANFNKKLSNIYKGLRHDSGDPIIFIKNAINHYRKLGINIQNKILIFSDNIQINIIKKILLFCKSNINIYFGIGTNLTNDIGFIPINIVIKMISSSIDQNNYIWTPVIKLSNSYKKRSGDINFINVILKKYYYK
jgi:nicotinate phosphoribosyltransferase